MIVEHEGNKRVSPQPSQIKQMLIEVEDEADIGSRSQQQDACMVSDPKLYSERGILAVLSDGMGGMKNGERFSAIAVKEMVRSFSEEEPMDDICAELLRAYASARTKALASCDEDEPEGGATVVAVLVRKNMCAFLSVGDSRIYLLRGGGLIQLNREQTLGCRLDEAAKLGYIPQEEARENLRRAALTNHLCEQELKPIDRCDKPFALRPGDKIALMSDGVFGTLSEAEIARCLMHNGPQGAIDVIDEIRIRKKNRQDNASALVMAFKEKRKPEQSR